MSQRSWRKAFFSCIRRCHAFQWFTPPVSCKSHFSSQCVLTRKGKSPALASPLCFGKNHFCKFNEKSSSPGGIMIKYVLKCRYDASRNAPHWFSPVDIWVHMDPNLTDQDPNPCYNFGPKNGSARTGGENQRQCSLMNKAICGRTIFFREKSLLYFDRRSDRR